MLFLLNDTVFKLEASELVPPLDAERFRRLTFDFVVDLGRELFAEQPLLQRAYPGRAARLAALIAAKAPRINAALFVAPGFRCPTSLVTSQFAEIPFEVMVKLCKREADGGRDLWAAERHVWSLLAA